MQFTSKAELNDEMIVALKKLADSAISLHKSGNPNYFTTAITGLTINKWQSPTPPTAYSLQPSICLIAQGVKRVILGEESYTYDRSQFLISSVGLPVVANIVEATSEEPYIGLVLELDLQEISQLILESKLPFDTTKQPPPGMAVGSLNMSILDAFQRLLDLCCEDKESIEILMPAVKREIFYRLLKTPQGQRLAQIVTTGSHSYQISRAIDWLYEHYSEPLSVTELAKFSGMSKSAFHNHFRATTSMTPLQFQKKLRLNEARRLMLVEHLDASETTYKVGYESPSQFSREYARFFGLPPKRDIDSLRNQPYLSL